MSSHTSTEKILFVIRRRPGVSRVEGYVAPGDQTVEMDDAPPEPDSRRVHGIVGQTTRITRPQPYCGNGLRRLSILTVTCGAIGSRLAHGAVGILPESLPLSPRLSCCPRPGSDSERWHTVGVAGEGQVLRTVPDTAPPGWRCMSGEPKVFANAPLCVPTMIALSCAVLFVRSSWSGHPPRRS